MKKDQRKINFKEAGITLIALVVTIIILLILAGITLSFALGENALLIRAKEVRVISDKSQIREEVTMLLMQAQIENSLENSFGSENVTKDGAIYEVAYKGEIFLIGENYEYIEKVEPAYEGEWTINENTGTLTAYNGDLTTKRGMQEVGELIIPNYYKGKRIKNIGTQLFYYNPNKSNIIKLVISEGIETIGNSAFVSCSNIKGDLVIPNSVTTIGSQAFTYCNSLNGNLVLGNNVQSIGAMAFYNCKFIGDLHIPNSVTTIGNRAFQLCSSMNGNMKMSENIEELQGETFYCCSNLTGNIVIPEKVEVIRFRAFYGCSKLNSITILNRNTRIEDISETAHDTFSKNITLKGYQGSTTEIYANTYGYKFEAID